MGLCFHFTQTLKLKHASFGDMNIYRQIKNMLLGDNILLKTKESKNIIPTALLPIIAGYQLSPPIKNIHISIMVTCLESHLMCIYFIHFGNSSTLFSRFGLDCLPSYVYFNKVVIDITFLGTVNETLKVRVQ